MPRVTEYSAETVANGLPPTRNATGSDFGADVGAGMVKLGTAAEDASDVLYKNEVANDVTSVRVQMAKTRAEQDVRFREEMAKAKPGDPTFSDRFTQKVKEALDKNGEAVRTKEGQRAYDQLSAELNAHFIEKAGLFEVQSAGVKASLDWDVAQRAYATSVITDPTSYASVRDQALAELRDRNGQYGRVDQNTREKLETKTRDTLAQAYVNGLIDNGAPELARKKLMDGVLDDQLEPKDKQRLIHSADAGITAKRVFAEHQDALARKAEKDRVAAVNDDLMGKFSAGKLTFADVRQAGIPAFGDGSQHTWITMLRQQTKELQEKPIRTVPSVVTDAFERINLPAGDARKITNINDLNALYVREQVSFADLQHLRSEFKNQQTEAGQRLGQVQGDFMKGVKTQLDKSTMNSLDAGGAERVYRFNAYVAEQVATARAANQDPYELFNPASSKYLGKAVPSFQTGAQRTQADLSKRIGDSLDKGGARKAGETPQQFLDRTKKP